MGDIKTLEQQCEQIRKQHHPLYDEQIETMWEYINELKSQLAELRRPSDAKEIAEIQERHQKNEALRQQYGPLHLFMNIADQAHFDRQVLLHALAESQRDNARITAREAGQDVEAARTRCQLAESQRECAQLQAENRTLDSIIVEKEAKCALLAASHSRLEGALRLARKYARCSRDCGGSEYRNGQRVACGCGFAEALPTIAADGQQEADIVSDAALAAKATEIEGYKRAVEWAIENCRGVHPEFGMVTIRPIPLEFADIIKPPAAFDQGHGHNGGEAE